MNAKSTVKSPNDKFDIKNYFHSRYNSINNIPLNRFTNVVPKFTMGRLKGIISTMTKLSYGTSDFYTSVQNY